MTEADMFPPGEVPPEAMEDVIQMLGQSFGQIRQLDQMVTQSAVSLGRSASDHSANELNRVVRNAQHRRVQPGQPHHPPVQQPLFAPQAPAVVAPQIDSNQLELGFGPQPSDVEQSIKRLETDVRRLANKIDRLIEVLEK